MDGAGRENTVAQTLAGALAGEGDVTVRRLVQASGERAFGLLLVLLNLPNALFAPPVLAGIAALPTAALGFQMVLGHSRLWLPEALMERPVAAPALRRLLDRAGPWLDRIEILGRPRLAWATGGAAHRIFGLFAILAAIIVLLPVPGTNVLPAFALIVMAIAVPRRDGLLFLAGVLIGMAGLAVAILATGIAVEVARWAWAALGS